MICNEDSVDTQVDPLDQQIEFIRMKRRVNQEPLYTAEDPMPRTDDQYRKMALETPILVESGGSSNDTVANNVVLLDASGCECRKNSSSGEVGDEYDNIPTCISFETAQQLYSGVAVKEYVEPSVKQMEDDISKALGRQVTFSANAVTSNESEVQKPSSAIDEALPAFIPMEAAQQLCRSTAVKEYVEPSVRQMEDDVSRMLGYRVAFNPDAGVGKKLSQISRKARKKIDDKMSAYQCAVTIFSEHKLCFLDSPETTSTIYRFNGRIWTPVTPTWLRDTVLTTLTEEELLSMGSLETYAKNVRSFLIGFASVEYSNGKCFTDDDFLRVKNHAVFLNCVYDTATGEVLSHSADLPYERLIHVNYDPNDTPTPAYDKLVSFATAGDPSSMDMFDYAIAYLAVPNRTGKCLFYFGTAPDSGKSILSDSIYKCFGDRSYPIEPEHLSGRFSYANAGNAHIYCCADMRKCKLSSTIVGQLKRNVGDRVIRMERKHQNEEQVTVRFKMILVSNFKLLIEGDQHDEAFYRRVIVLPFIQSVSPEQRDFTLGERLDSEMSAVFSKCVRRLHEITDENGGIIFPESQLSKDIKESWYLVSDMVDEFLEQNVQVAPRLPKKRPVYLSCETLYEEYSAYVDKIGATGVDVNECDYHDFKKKVVDKYAQVKLGRGRPPKGENPVSSFVNLAYKKK